MIRTLAVIILAVAMISISVTQIQTASAHPHNGSTTYVSLGDGIALERTQLTINIPTQNIMPWAFVEGVIKNPAMEYPVIVQIHERNGEPVRFGQVDVAEDGSYEYKFRVFSLDEGQVVRAFEGDYDVTVYKVVHINSQIDYA